MAGKFEWCNVWKLHVCMNVWMFESYKSECLIVWKLEDWKFECMKVTCMFDECLNVWMLEDRKFERMEVRRLNVWTLNVWMVEIWTYTTLRLKFWRESLNDGMYVSYINVWML